MTQANPTMEEVTSDVETTDRDRMNDAHHNYYKKLHATKDSYEAYKCFDIRDREHFQCRIRINEALLSMERQTSDKMSLVS